MCEPYNPQCSCDEWPVAFRDGQHLDPAVAEAILQPYLQLLEQWRAKVYKRWPGASPGPSNDPMLYSPAYLKAVINEYLWLRNSGDRPDPAVAAHCEQIVAQRPEIAAERRSYLTDPWRRAQSAEALYYRVATVADYYDPDFLQSKVDYANRLEDPFDGEAIKTRLCVDRWNAGSPQAADAPYN